MKPKLPFRGRSGACVLALISFCAISNGTLIAIARGAPRNAQQGPSQKPVANIDEHRIHDALCSVVYQVDRTPGPRGYRYIFYGNAFFINEDGYLLTAAHVLSQLHGGQPSLLLRSAAAGPHFVQASVAAIDREHDVAVLLATPNPFANQDAVAFLPLSHESAAPGTRVLVAALRPGKPRNAWTRDAAFEEREPGEVLRFELSRLEKGAPETELFIFNYDVRLGQSGAPVLAMESGGVAGLVEGQWLRDDVSALAPPRDATNGVASAPGELVSTPGAAVPIRYAIELLKTKGITWHEASVEKNSEAP